LGDHLRRLRGDGRGEQRAPELLLGELRGGDERPEVELDVLGVSGKCVLQVVDRHHTPASSFLASRVSSPLFQLHGQSSSDWSASRTRRTSLTFRPTEPAVTMTNWISLFGSTMKVARSATPSLFRMPRAPVSSRL